MAQGRTLIRGRTLRRWLLRGLGALAALLALLGAYFWVSTPLPTPEHLRARAALGSTRILDRRGQLLYALPDPLSGARHPLALADIPPALRQATIAVEDASFARNPGVDLRGIARALWANWRGGALTQGGSTITQQLARNFLLDTQQRTLTRKIRETVLALKLTAVYAKDDILALYLNQTYYGGLSYGVEAAAQHYFGKPARDLDLAECALLAGLPQAPSAYDPLAHRAEATARQAQVLDALLRAGSISAAQAEAAKREPLQFAEAAPTMRAPHFVRYVLAQLEAQYGAETLARGGLVVTTTLDADLNDAAQAALRRQVALLSTPSNGGPDHRVRNGAVVVLAPQDGAILAMVGSPNYDDAAIQGQVNGALALRQPGSAIKPLTYAAALERGWTPATTILDVPTTFTTRDGTPYAPQNYDRAFHGPLALREALANSSNVAAVRTLASIGIPALLDMAQRLGVASLGKDSGRYGLALTLGGGELTPLELTAAYAAFANGGARVTPYSVVGLSCSGLRTECSASARTSQPTTLSPQPSALSPQVAYLITDILSDRYARMRAFGEVSALDIDRPAAAKTGTTSDWRDNWTVGYTPDRVVGVWVGNSDGQPMEDISGISGAGPVWHEVMLAAHKGLPPRPFARPDGISEVAVCAEGGLLPSPTCPATRLERFVKGTEPTRSDDTHEAVRLDPARDCRAPAGYPAAQVVTRIFRALPAEAQDWAITAGVPRVPKIVCRVEAETSRLGDKQTDPQPAAQSASLPASQSPALVSPAPGTTYALSPGVPRERQRIELVARGGGDVAALKIIVDGSVLATLRDAPYRAWWQLAPGTHIARVEATDAQGRVRRGEDVTFVVTE